MWNVLCRLPVVEVEVPVYELPLPEGVGEERLRQEHMSVREIEESWRERLLDNVPTRTREPSQ